MDEQRRPDIEERIAGLREGISDADATGMVAGEELITQAETRLPLEPSALPRDALHAALPDAHSAHTTIDRLNAEMGSPQPSRAAIEGLAGKLRAVPELEAAVALWWESPAMQRFLWNLTQTGL